MISWWEVLKASKGLPVNDYYAQMWGKQLGGTGYVIADFTAPLPLTITTDGTALIDYRIYGNTVNGESVGVQTESGEPTGYKLPMVSRSENLYNKNDPDIVYSAYMRSDGTIIHGPYGDVVKVSGYIPINGGKTYIGTNLMNIGSGNYYSYYDANKQRIAGALVHNDMVFNSPINAAYIRTTVIHRNIEDIAMITEGSTPPDHYIPYYREETPIYIGDTKLAKDEYVSYSEQKVYWRTENLFNYQSKNTENGYQDGKAIRQNGNTLLSNLYAISEYIEVVEGFTYTWTFAIYRPSMFSVTAELLDQNKSRVSVVEYGAQAVRFSFEVPSGIKYIRISIYKPFVEEAMLTTFTPSSYIPYYDPQEPPVPLPALPTTKGETTIEYAGGEPQPEQMYVKYRRKD